MDAGFHERVLVAGAGDIGLRMAELERQRGRRVWLLARTPERAGILRELGYAVMELDLDTVSTQPPACLQPQLAQGWHTVYYTIPPASSAGHDSDVRLTRLLAWLKAEGSLPAQWCYISTSGVYGPHDGAWVNESTPPAPVTARGRRRLAAEHTLEDWCQEQGVLCRILRVPGIYGPGRLPLARIRQRLPVVHPDEAPWSNRIHADDLAAIAVHLMHVLETGKPFEVFNVSDGRPSTMTEYFFDVADLAGLPRPPAISMQEAREVFTPQLMSFLDESRRLDISKLQAVPGICLRFPDSREAIRQILLEEGTV